MDYGATESISISAFVEGALALALPLSKRYIFPNPFICLLFVLLLYLQVPFYKVSSHSIIAWDWAKRGKVSAQVWTSF
jgi:hypothetical protein